MDAYDFGVKLAAEKTASGGLVAKLLAKAIAGGRATGRFAGAVDGAAASVLRGLGSGASGIGGLFNRAAAGGRAAGKGIKSMGNKAVAGKGTGSAADDALKMLGYSTKNVGRLVENTGGGAGLLSSGFNALGKGLHGVANIGKGVPTAAVGGLGYGGVQSGVLQNPLYVAPKSDHIDIKVKSPLTLPSGVRERIFGKEKLKPRAMYSATGRRLG
jgi:hypothetical protein